MPDFSASMSDFYQADLMVRGGSLALLALWSWILVRDHWGALPARMALLMNATIACHVVATMPGPMGRTPVDWLFELGAASVPGMFWLFARTWFNDETHVGWRSWALVGLSVANVALIMLAFPAVPVLAYCAAVAMRGAMIAFALAGLWIAWRGREGDLVEARRRLRVRLVGSVGAYVILTNLVEVLVHNGLAPQIWRSLIEVGVLGLTFSFCAAMFGTRQPDLFGASLRAEPDRRSPADDPLATRLLAFMESQKPHRDETLTIASLAAQLGEQEYRLRRLINGTLGHRNFAAFLNGYRLAEVKAALTDPAQGEVPILTIALDAGFGSLGPFNRAFREAEGMTPSRYRQRFA